MAKFMHNYNITQNETTNKKEKDFEENRVRCQHFHSSFAKWFAHKCY